MREKITKCKKKTYTFNAMYKAKRLNWNNGKPHGQNAHQIEKFQAKFAPPTRHENAPVATQLPFQLRDFALWIKNYNKAEQKKFGRLTFFGKKSKRLFF